MEMLKLMGIITICSVFFALISIIFQAFVSLQKLNRIMLLTNSLLNNESTLLLSYGDEFHSHRIAVGYGACTDLVVNASIFFNFTEEINDNYRLLSDYDIGQKEIEENFIQNFLHYFKNGAAAERTISDSGYYDKIIEKLKTDYKNEIQWSIGGNAPLMAIRFLHEGHKVLIGAPMSDKLRRLLPAEIEIAGDLIDADDIHLILEYKLGDRWGNYVAPRANRFIVHNDKMNPYITSLEKLELILPEYKPHLFVISGLQMMDMYPFSTGVRENRLRIVQNQILRQKPTTLIHFEMASYVELELLNDLRKFVLPYVDSLGMNEQELTNLHQVLENGSISHASDSNPRIANTLDQMRSLFKILYNESSQNREKHNPLTFYYPTRIHVHTLAYQAIITVKDSKWKSGKMAALKAALTAFRYVCQTEAINPEAATLILDSSFSTSAKNETQRRIKIDHINSLPCWDELIDVKVKTTNNELPPIKVEICIAPVLVCRSAKKTAGAGDNISAAALSYQI